MAISLFLAEQRNTDSARSLSSTRKWLHLVYEFASPNKSLLRSGGRWYLVCKSLASVDKVPMISLGEPPAAELSRWAALIANLRDERVLSILDPANVRLAPASSSAKALRKDRLLIEGHLLE